MHHLRADQHLTMVVRLIIVGLIAITLALGLRYWPRRRGANVRGVPIGLTLVTSSGCTECVRAVDALHRAGATYMTVDARDSAVFGIKTLSVPVAVVGNREGEAVMVRRGTAIASDAHRLAEATAALAKG
jgi:glutaredoxin